VLDFPVLDREPGPLGRWLSSLPGEGHPVWTYVLGVLLSFASIACLSILAGLLVTRVLLHVHGIASDDEWLAGFFARHRSVGLTDASLVGSIMGGGVVLPIIAACAALVALIAKRWRLAAFLGCALAVESGSYRATTLVIHRHRPEVHRLEKLPVNASYPSGHTAAAIAVYCGIALLLTSRIANRGARVTIWVLAALIPVFVAFARMYRGMHHPLDVFGGVVVGVAALSALVLVVRASGTAAR
jgi:membrane-associated phospholipid phosphatase